MRGLVFAAFAAQAQGMMTGPQYIEVRAIAAHKEPENSLKRNLTLTPEEEVIFALPRGGVGSIIRCGNSQCTRWVNMRAS